MRTSELTELENELLEALKEFMDVWNSGDAIKSSIRAQRRRADMWDKAIKAVKKAEDRPKKG